MTIAQVLTAINTAGTVGVLVVVLWLGLRGDVVTAAQLRACEVARDTYLSNWLRAVDRTTVPGASLGPPPWREYEAQTWLKPSISPTTPVGSTLSK